MGKKIGLFIGIVLVVIIGICGTFFLLNREEKKEVYVSTTGTTTAKTEKEKIWLTFDTDGGNPIDQMDIDKGSTAVLPVATKDGYRFAGWYVEDTLVRDDQIFNEDTTLKASWKKAPNTTAMSFKVTFDSKGGSKVNSFTVVCGKELKLPKNPTKEGYDFVSWTDKNGTTIHDKALLACENITLTANWVKSTTTTTTTKKTDAQVVYKCSEGKLEGDKCVITKEPTKVCPNNTIEDGDICIMYSDKKAGTRECGKKTVHWGGGHTEEVQGVIYNAPYASFCYYGEVTNTTDQNTCTSQGRQWNSTWKKCYLEMDSNYTTTGCPTNYKYYSSEDLLKKFNAHDGGGCFRVYNKGFTCDKDYVLKDNKCTKTVNATKA